MYLEKYIDIFRFFAEGEIYIFHDDIRCATNKKRRIKKSQTMFSDVFLGFPMIFLVFRCFPLKIRLFMLEILIFPCNFIIYIYIYIYFFLCNGFRNCGDLCSRID